MYAIIKTGGKQYRVEEGNIINIEKLKADQEEQVEFDQVLAVSKEDTLTLGTPLVEGAKVLGKVLEQGKDKKIIVFKYKAKKDYRRKQGHRQPFTRVLIEKIEA